MIRHSTLEKHLYNILGCAISGKDLEAERLKDVTSEVWHEVYLMGKAQGVSGLLFDKIKTLPKEVAPPKELVMQWMSHAISIERQTKALFEKSAEFAELMAKESMQTVVLKGLALCGYYPNPWYREYGDLDCYLCEFSDGRVVWDGCYERGNLTCEKFGMKAERGFYKHSHIKYRGLEIENHQFALPIKDGEEVRALERELRRCVATADCLKQIGNTHLYRPSADFTALFLTAHSMRHFLFESIKLRHVLDWAFFVKAEGKNVDWDNFWHWCERMKYTRFVMCMNYICEHHLGMELPEALRMQDDCVPELCDRILKDTYDGYSLYTQNHSGLVHRMIMLTRYLRSLWKFHEVHQRNAFYLMARRIKNYWIKDVRL